MVAIAVGATAVIAGKPVAAPSSDAPIPVLTARARAVEVAGPLVRRMATLTGEVRGAVALRPLALLATGLWWRTRRRPGARA